MFPLIKVDFSQVISAKQTITFVRFNISQSICLVSHRPFFFVYFDREPGKIIPG